MNWKLNRSKLCKITCTVSPKHFSKTVFVSSSAAHPCRPVLSFSLFLFPSGLLISVRLSSCLPAYPPASSSSPDPTHQQASLQKWAAVFQEQQGDSHTPSARAIVSNGAEPPAAPGSRAAKPHRRWRTASVSRRAGVALGMTGGRASWQIGLILPWCN